MHAYHVSRPGLEPGTMLVSDFQKHKPKVSAFVRACVQGADVFASSYIASGYAHAVLESTLNIELGSSPAKWAAEGLLEYVRATEFPALPARHQSIFLFDKAGAAHAFVKDFRQHHASTIYKCRVENPARLHVGDMHGFTEINSLLASSAVRRPISDMMPDLYEAARRYWAPPAMPSCPELLVQGGNVVVEEPVGALPRTRTESDDFSPKPPSKVAP